MTSLHEASKTHDLHGVKWNRFGNILRLSGMIFCVSVGFSGLVKKGENSEKDKQYALFIGDTVLVNEVGLKVLWIDSASQQNVTVSDLIVTSFLNLE